MSLKNEDYLILKHILQEPILPHSKLAEKVKLSPPTVKKRIEGLLDANIITSFHAEYHPESVGLESHIFILRVDSIDKYWIVERIIDYHPYLVVRQRCYGGITGIFIKVHIPIDSINKFLNFLDYLKESNLVEEIVHSTTIGRGIKTRIDLTYWDPILKKWLFKWDIWKKNIDSVDYVPQFDYFQRIAREKPKNVIRQLKHLDFLILKELVHNPTQKYVLLSKQLKLPQYTVSRRKRFLSKYVIRNYLVDFDRSFFGLEDELVFKAICSQRAMSKIIYLLQNLDLPYESDFRDTETGFLWKILLPPKDKIELINLLWSLFPDLQIMILDPYTTVTKLFNPGNYSFMDQSWKDSEDYMINQVLEKAKEELLLA
ncbi:MAG: Lrp/AsnC family transcriptional regulator [Asgard group archaeon]|nr:Lrp/AsnC family transcriptional regulator [Asgard group archaeon]